ncbi:MAG: hypothetical protein AAGD01_20920 [Acidobacteriota bacterium]
MKILRLKVSVLVLVVGLALVLVPALLFRQETVTNPELGEITYKWRWGFARVMELDIDSDGSKDARALFAYRSAHFHTHQSPTEYWEDQDDNGRFDVHARFEEGGIISVSLDIDDDGIFDRTLDCAEAASFFSRRSILGLESNPNHDGEN